ncbi:prepilin peptidase [Desulfarculus baarsii]
MNSWRAMERQGAAAMVARELEGAYWGLLPAFLCWPLLAMQTSLGPAPATMTLMASLMAGHDVVDRRIPNALTALTAVVGLALSGLLGGWAGLGWSALGGLLVLGLTTVFFLMGALGGGDVKALAALATFVGPASAAWLLLLTALAGGALALGLLIAGRRWPASFAPTMPYGLAIWCGVVLLWAVRP